MHIHTLVNILAHTLTQALALAHTWIHRPIHAHTLVNTLTQTH